MLPSPLERAYRTQLATVRARVVAAVERAYGEDIDPDDIAGSFDAFANRVAPTVAAGQDAAQSLMLSYLASLASSQGVDFHPEPDPDIPGTNYKGAPLRSAMDPISGTILAAIGTGASVADAIGIGRTHLQEFTDNEVRGAADREMERQQAQPEVIGWRGDAGSCERCQSNNGDHDTSDEVYRHPGCTCVITPLFA